MGTNGKFISPHCDSVSNNNFFISSTFLMVNGKITVRNDKYDNTHVCYLTILTKELAFF